MEGSLSIIVEICEADARSGEEMGRRGAFQQTNTELPHLLRASKRPKKISKFLGFARTRHIVSNSEYVWFCIASYHTD